MKIFQLLDLPNEFDQLVDEASSDGHRFLEKMREEWANGTNRFNRENEILFGIKSANRLIAIGGLNIDPYIADPSIGRVRHVYVSKEFRGFGAGCYAPTKNGPFGRSAPIKIGPVDGPVCTHNIA